MVTYLLTQATGQLWATVTNEAGKSVSKFSKQIFGRTNPGTLSIDKLPDFPIIKDAPHMAYVAKYVGAKYTWVIQKTRMGNTYEESKETDIECQPIDSSDADLYLSLIHI